MPAADPWEIARTRDRAGREVELPGDGFERERWIEVLAQNPALIERPIARREGRAELGRPPERVLALLED